MTLAELVAKHKAAKPSGYLPLYERMFARDAAAVLELGVQSGGSLLVWRDYFPRAWVVGIDLELPVLHDPRIVMVEGDHANAAMLRTVSALHGPWDVVIDDGSHIGAIARISFDALWPFVRSGGLYAIEDLGTGYMPDWPDGAAFLPGHTAGMIRFLKDLIDQIGTGVLDATLTLIHNLAILEKR